MKRKMSCALAATLAASPLQSFANEVNVKSTSNEAIVSKSQKATITGKLEVDINFYMPIINSNNNDMKLILKGGQILEESPVEISFNSTSGTTASGINYSIEKLNSKREMVTSENEEISFVRVVFENLSVGQYGISLSGEGYLSTDVDNIDVTQYSKRIKIGTSHNEVVTKYDENGNAIKKDVYPAAFLPGDVNGDNVINLDDYNIIFNNMSKSNTNTKYDINKDGKSDIADLSYVNEGIKITREDAIIEDTDKIINPEEVNIEPVAQGVVVNGVIVTDEESQLQAQEELKKILKSGTSAVTIGNPEVEPSPQNPTKISFGLSKESKNDGLTKTATNISDSVNMEQVIIKSPTTSSNENTSAPENGNIVYTDENGQTHTVNFNNENIKETRSGQQDIVIDLGGQVAVKEITINVTGNRGNKNISEIAKIEFLNNVYKEVPKPKLSIPTIQTLETSTNLHDERITISWQPQQNVDGYEVKYYKIDSNGNRVGAEKKLQTRTNELNILDKAIKPYDIYRVSVQSLNGDWESGYAEDLAKLSVDNGGLTQEQKNKLIPYNLDGKADNVDSDFYPKKEYYGNNNENIEPNMGSVSDIQVVPLNAPEPPRNLTTKSGYKSFTVSWEEHRQARDFDIYYRKVGSSNKSWLKANENNIEVSENDNTVKNPNKSKLHRAGSYTLNNLDNESTYEVRVTATNHLGTSNMSQVYLGTTGRYTAPETINYKLINTPLQNVEEGKSPTKGIKDVTYPQYSKQFHPNGVEKFAVVDNDYSTHWMSQGGDARYDAGGVGGPIIEFEETQNIGGLTFISRLDGDYFNAGMYGEPHVKYEDENGNMVRIPNEKLKYSSGTGVEKASYKITFDEKITTKKIQVSYKLAVNGVAQNANISEIKIYEYDSLENDVKALFADDLRLVLKEKETSLIQRDIDELIKRANTIDPISGEYHPNKSTILKELDYAQKLLNDANVSEKITTLDTKIKNDNVGPTLGMQNDWQSLGSVARVGKTEDKKDKKIVVYVGSNDPGAKVEIGFLQVYGLPGADAKGKVTLGPGRHEVTIPQSIDADVEKGGPVMARVVGGKSDANIKIRLSNVEEIPHLNVNNIIENSNQVDLVKTTIGTYINDLKMFVNELPTTKYYPTQVSDTDKINNIYKYDEETSVLNSTDIEGDRFTLTVPATKILEGITNGIENDENAQIERVYKALLAWEQEMKVAFAKKGVYETIQDFNGNGSIDNEDTTYFNKHKAPENRINIKYQRMMSGAAGYASGHHVGVGFGSASDFMRGVPYEFDENKNLTNASEARLYGDLIGHEIGHVMDIGDRIYDETSNNLMTAITSNALKNQYSSKLDNDTYKQIYKKVTSDTRGLSTNRSVVLGMLWQPFLAYENNDTYRMLFNDNDANMSNDSYFAKLNRAYREMTAEERANGDKDQWLIRITSKIAQKDLSKFYYAHGITPNLTTLNYVSQWEEETRPIQYINDEARIQRLANNATMSSDTTLSASFGNAENGKEIKNKSYVNQNYVPLNLSVDKDNDKILGYEIYRNGKPAGFVERDKNSNVTIYNDVIDIVNNRTFEYKVVAYDYNLNKTNEVNLGTIKIKNDGSISKESLDITSNTVDKNEMNNDIHSHEPNPNLNNIKDKNVNTVYNGKKVEGSKEDPYIVIDTNSVRSIAGIKYTSPVTTTKLFKLNKLSKTAIQNYEVQVSKDGNEWTTAKTGTFNLSASDSSQTIYFDKENSSGGNQLNVYDARFVKLIAKGVSEISIAELDVITPPGDNIEIGLATDDTGASYENGIGILNEEFVYQVDNPNTEEDEKRSIPKGSVIITGEYRGNPAFNVPLVLNENDEHIANKYKGILMAQLPENAELDEIANGSWVYWVEPQYIEQFMQNKKVFAELYRTDTANADKGQRLVSNTFEIDVPTKLPSITLNSGQGRDKHNEVKYFEIDSKTIEQILNKR